MTLALIAALVLTVAGVLVLLDRKDARAARERDSERQERQILLQRIQAPEQAVAEYTQQHAAPDEPYPLSDEESAEMRYERELALERIEQFEREGLG